MPWKSFGRASSRPLGVQLRSRLQQRRCQHASLHIPSCQILSSWDIQDFRSLALRPQIPSQLPREIENALPASSEWFVHNRKSEMGGKTISDAPIVSELRESFWKQYRDVIVPLELTTLSNGVEPDSFHRADVPLQVLLDHLSQASASGGSDKRSASVYLAQCSLPSLPQSLRDALPTPRLVMKAGSGDVYDSSLWLGRPPTYTPLHRDPNPNLFVQLAGRKIVRLLPPNVGDLVFQRVQDAVHGRGRAQFRGEEMMVGDERAILEQGIWPSATRNEHFDAVAEDINAAVQRYGQQAELEMGQALFIPKGWWHSVKSIGEGVSASVNWWFR